MKIENEVNVKIEKKQDIPKEVKTNEIDIDKLIKSVIITAFIALNLFVLADMFFKIYTFGNYNIVNNTILFTMLFGVIIYSLILAIFKKSSIATVVSCSLILILNLVNQLKILYTGEPIYFSDIKFIGKVGDLLELETNNISFKSTIRLIIGFGIYIIILLITIFFSYKYSLEIKSKKTRISIIIIDAILLFLLFFPNNYTKNFYLKVFFDTDNYADFNSYTTSATYYYRNNLINGMYGTYLNNIFVEPNNYDENKLNEILNSSVTENEKFGKPNIIIVLSEAFWDVDQLEEIDFNTEITKNFNNLKEKGKFINLVSPTYGGMSENVAFELLTGGSMNYFPRGYIPIMSLYSRKNSENIPSLVKVLNNNGYYSKIVFGKDYYNSKKAYLKMGFNEYIELSENKNYKKITDDYCINTIIEELENKSEDTPLFYVLETIESHMPYSKNKYSDYDISITKSNLSDSMNDTLLAYAQGIYNSDKALGKLYEYINNYNEPTILLFLGDHLPYLYTSDYQNVINHLDYFNTNDELLNEYRKYNTQCLILSNYDIENMNTSEYGGVDVLLNSIVNNLDIKNEKYYEWLDTTKNILSGSNRSISLDENGKNYSTNDITGEMKEIYDTKELMQYKFFMK